MSNVILHYSESHFDHVRELGIGSATIRHKMVARLQTMGLANPKVIKALQMVPRHIFVDAGFLPLAYDESKALPIGYRQTLSQPQTVARMLQWLFAEQGDHNPLDKILEIGSGSGYQSAILALLASEVYTLERIPELAQQAVEKLHLLKLSNVTLGTGDGHWGWQQHAPYDAIISAAAPEVLPQELIHQLRIGGRLVMPIGNKKQRLTGFIRHAKTIEEIHLGEASFVPMLAGIQPAG